MSLATDGNVEIFSTAVQLAAAAADRFVEAARGAIDATGSFSVALSGGSTPRALFASLASPRYASLVEWPRVHVFWGDERCVPPDDAESNYRMARELLLDHVPVAAANVHRIRGEDAPWRASVAYEAELRAAFGTPGGAPQAVAGARLDLVLLGLGANGHTASLFPHLRAVREQTRWVMAEEVETLDMWRVTLTPVILNQAAEVLFLVAGRDKAAIVRRVLYGRRDADEYPAQAIVPAAGRLRWFVDAAAASDLSAT